MYEPYYVQFEYSNFLFLFSNIRITLYSRRKYQLSFVGIRQEEFEDTKGIIKSCNSKKDIQYNGQKKREDKQWRTTCYNKLKNDQHEPYYKEVVNSGAPKE